MPSVDMFLAITFMSRPCSLVISVKALSLSITRWDCPESSLVADSSQACCRPSAGLIRLHGSLSSNLHSRPEIELS